MEQHTVDDIVELINVRLFEFRPINIEYDPEDRTRFMLITNVKEQSNHLRRKRNYSDSTYEPVNKKSRYGKNEALLIQEGIILTDYLDSPIDVSPNEKVTTIMRAFVPPNDIVFTPISHEDEITARLQAFDEMLRQFAEDESAIFNYGDETPDLILDFEAENEIFPNEAFVNQQPIESGEDPIVFERNEEPDSENFERILDGFSPEELHVLFEIIMDLLQDD